MTELGRARRESIWLPAVKHRPRCVRSVCLDLESQNFPLPALLLCQQVHTCIIIWQVNPSVLIGSYSVRILPYLCMQI